MSGSDWRLLPAGTCGGCVLGSVFMTAATAPEASVSTSAAAPAPAIHRRFPGDMAWFAPLALMTPETRMGWLTGFNGHTMRRSSDRNAELRTPVAPRRGAPLLVDVRWRLRSRP